jgi:hypothetical protein
MKTRTRRSAAALQKSIVLLMMTGLALAGRAPAQSITWYDKGTEAASETPWYHPRIAGDGFGDFVVVGLDETTTSGLLADWAGNNPLGETSLNGADYGILFALDGSFPSIATQSTFDGGGGGCGSLNTAVEVHQGGQNGGAALWSEISVYTFEFGDTTFGPLSFTGAQNYDTGYNPSVAIDIAPCLPNNDNLPVVEVHQAASGMSGLWYHVGTLANAGYSSQTLTWGPSHLYGYGNRASVIVNNGQVIEVHESDSGTLWYTIGTLGAENTINWSASRQYDNGYHPSLTYMPMPAEYGGAPTVVEVHQAGEPATGESTALWYHVATYTPSAVNWTPATRYDTGCGPSVAPGFGNRSLGHLSEYLVEIHVSTCGETGPLLYDFGSISF